MEPRGYSLFATPIGVCGIAWSDLGIVRLALPDGDPRTTRARLQWRYPHCAEQEPPEPVAAAISAIVEHLEHGSEDLSHFAVDLEGVPDFERRVLEEARTIPPGSTRTYGDLARAVGNPGGAQAVGRALSANPVALLVPCHRVVAAGGNIGGFSAAGGAETKRRILRIEGSELGAGQETLFDA